LVDAVSARTQTRFGIGQRLLIAERHVVLYCVKKNMCKSVAMLPQV